VEYWLNTQNKTCSGGDIQKIVKIFEKCKNQIPKYCKCMHGQFDTGRYVSRYVDDSGKASYGFYIGLLRLEKYETDPKLFFQILEIDQKIGWVNPDHVEENVFYYKGIKIIEDQNVSLKKFKFSANKTKPEICSSK